MAEEIAFENGRISNFEGLVTLTLDKVTLHTVVHQSSTSTYMPNFIKIKNFLWTDGRTYALTDGHLRPALLSRLCQRVDLIKRKKQNVANSVVPSHLMLQEKINHIQLF